MKKSIVELLEDRQKMADELAEVKLKKANIKLKLKEANISDDLVKQLKEDADELVKKATKLKDDLASVNSDIEETEEELQKAAKKMKESKKGTNVTDYLKTKAAGLDFARILLDNQGNSHSARKAWEEKLVQKGVTNLEKILPEPVLIAIQDAFVDYSGILNNVSKDPRYAVTVALQTALSAGKGHKAGKVKKDEDFSFSNFTIQTATVYIKYAFDYADIKKDTTGVYFNYVMKELANGFIRAVERAIVIGDGKDSRADDKITEIKSIAEETEAALFETQNINLTVPSYDQSTLEKVVAGIDKMVPTATPILVTSKDVARKLKLVKDQDGRYIDPQPFAPISQTGNSICGYTVYVYDWMTDATNPLIAVADKAYTMVGDDVAADRFEDYDVTMNRRHIELASVMGGRLTQYKSAVKFVQSEE